MRARRAVCRRARVKPSPLDQTPAVFSIRLRLPGISSDAQTKSEQCLTPRTRVGIVQGAMLWLRRCVVLVPVGVFLGAALLLSCGGGSSTAPASTPFSLMSLAVCPGSPPTTRPTPTPTKGVPTPTRTPTPQCTPTAEASIAGLSAPDNTVQFNVQGTFQQNPNSRKLFFDQTNNLALRWNVQPGGLATSGVTAGQFVGLSPGCACLTAQIVPAISCPVSVSVATTGCTPCPTPPPFNLCPGPIPTPTPTK